MKKVVLTRAIVLVLAIAIACAVSIPAGAAYLCKPTSFSAVYNLETETITYSGTYTGLLKSTNVYMIMLLDGNGVMVSTRNPRGNEFDKGNGTFEISYHFSLVAYNETTQPMKATLSSVTANLIQPISADVVVVESVEPEKHSVSFTAGANGSIGTAVVIEVENGTDVADITFPGTTANTGYVFDKWVASEGCVTDGKVVDDVVFTAQFKPVLGDVNSDGYIDNLDAVQIIQYDVGSLNEILAAAADVNNDGYVDNLDAAIILKYDAGIIDSI